jgi:transcriptional regulator with XRE-family HTH domain
MKIADQVPDTAVLSELGARLARLRLERNLKQADLAAQAGVSKRTLERMEAGGATQLANLVRVCRALGLVERFELLVPEPLPSPLEQLKLRGRQRKRAATPRIATAVQEPVGKWQWSDKP